MDVTMEVTAAALAESVAELVRIPSVNPLQAGPRAGVPGELAIGSHLARRFDELGATEVVLDEVVDGRPNVYGVFPGRSDRLVALDVHTDTVTVEHMTDDPFDGRLEHDRVWGRGALDTKATMGVALALLSVWARHDLRPGPSLVLVGSVGEEAGGLLGAARFRDWALERRLRIEQLIAAEPTKLRPIHGHKGGLSMRVTAVGLAAHSALPHLGRNAIDAMVPVLAAIAQEHDRLVNTDAMTELGTATLTTGTISGGTASNVVPDRCSIVVGRRVVPGEDADVEFGRLADLVTRACPLPVEIECLHPIGSDGRRGLDAFYTAAGTPLVRRLGDLAGTVPAVAPFGTNALRYHELCDEIAVFGPGSIDDAHQATESIAVADLAETARILGAWLDPGAT